jgi:hypothetical protein
MTSSIMKRPAAFAPPFNERASLSLLRSSALRPEDYLCGSLILMKHSSGGAPKSWRGQRQRHRRPAGGGGGDELGPAVREAALRILDDREAA